MANVYFHIDMNAFFVSAEILLDPSLKGKPVAIAGNTRRSVVSTASYEARKYGIHSAMPIQEALHLCNELVVVPGHYKYYEELSNQFITLIKSYTPLVEQASIDECYADMSEPISHYDKPLDLAYEIQRRIYEELHLPCSIGVAPNLFLAKMASDMKKPMGITVLRIRDVQDKMWPLPIGDMRGIGKKTEEILKGMGIHTIKDLATYRDIHALKKIFGKNTEAIINRTKGQDSRELVTEWNAKSKGVSETLLEDVTDYDELCGILRMLSRKLSLRMKEDRKLGQALSIRIKYFDFRNVDRSVKLDKAIWKSEDIYSNAITLFEDNYENIPVRLLGISLSSLKDGDMYVSQLDIFNMQQANTEETRSVLLDLNKKMDGQQVFMRASDLLEKQK